MAESRAARSRREQDEIERDRLAHERPNEPPAPRDPTRDCPQSKYGVHRFVARTSAGLTCCEFCGELLQAWLRRARPRPQQGHGGVPPRFSHPLDEPEEP